jgi:hypothetical protein
LEFDFMLNKMLPGVIARPAVGVCIAVACVMTAGRQARADAIYTLDLTTTQNSVPTSISVNLDDANPSGSDLLGFPADGYVPLTVASASYSDGPVQFTNGEEIDLEDLGSYIQFYVTGNEYLRFPETFDATATNNASNGFFLQVVSTNPIDIQEATFNSATLSPYVAVPEPTALGLLGVGAVGLLGRRRGHV